MHKFIKTFAVFPGIWCSEIYKKHFTSLRFASWDIFMREFSFFSLHMWLELRALLSHHTHLTNRLSSLCLWKAWFFFPSVKAETGLRAGSLCGNIWSQWRTLRVGLGLGLDHLNYCHGWILLDILFCKKQLLQIQTQTVIPLLPLCRADLLKPWLRSRQTRPIYSDSTPRWRRLKTEESAHRWDLKRLK